MGTGGDVFTAFVEGEVKAERERRNALDARGIAVLTTSGTLVTLVFAIGAVVTGATGFSPPAETVVIVTIGLVAFVAAALFGLLANRLKKYDVVTTGQLWSWRNNAAAWAASDQDARRAITKGNIVTIDTLRAGNDTKAKWIEAALWAQL